MYLHAGNCKKKKATNKMVLYYNIAIAVEFDNNYCRSGNKSI